MSSLQKSAVPEDHHFGAGTEHADYQDDDHEPAHETQPHPLARATQEARMLSSDSEPRREQDHVPPLAEGHQAVSPTVRHSRLLLSPGFQP